MKKQYHRTNRDFQLLKDHIMYDRSFNYYGSILYCTYEWFSQNTIVDAIEDTKSKNIFKINENLKIFFEKHCKTKQDLFELQKIAFSLI